MRFSSVPSCRNVNLNLLIICEFVRSWTAFWHILLARTTSLYFYLCEDFHWHKKIISSYPNKNHANDPPDPTLNPLLTPTLKLMLNPKNRPSQGSPMLEKILALPVLPPAAPKPWWFSLMVSLLPDTIDVWTEVVVLFLLHSQKRSSRDPEERTRERRRTIPKDACPPTHCHWCVCLEPQQPLDAAPLHTSTLDVNISLISGSSRFPCCLCVSFCMWGRWSHVLCGWAV